MDDNTEKDPRLVVAEMIFRNGRGNKVVSNSKLKFDVPVNISEVKILSPRMYLKSSNGGLIRGNTMPTELTLQFFCNNVDNPDAPMIDLGTINYQENRRSTFRCQTTMWSDTLTVRAQFYTLGIGVYGLPRDLYAEYLQKRDPSSNQPNLNFPGSIPGVAYDYYSYLDSSPETVLRKFEPYSIDSEDEEEEEEDATSKGSQSDSQVDNDDDDDSQYEDCSDDS